MTLKSTGGEIAAFMYAARTRREGDHPDNGNLFADCLDALIAHTHDEDACSAERLLDVARQIYSRADVGGGE